MTDIGGVPPRIKALTINVDGTAFQIMVLDTPEGNRVLLDWKNHIDKLVLKTFTAATYYQMKGW